MSDIYERLAESLAHLSGGRVTAADVRARVERDAQQASSDRLTAAEVITMHSPLSGSHTVTRSMRVTGWEPQPRPDWSKAGWLRDPNGRFRALGPDEAEHD